MDEKVPNKVRFNKHPRRKNNDLVANMYAHYSEGRSLAEIAAIYGRSRQAVYDVFRTRGYELRSKRLEGLTVIDGIGFTLTKGGHLRGTTPRGRMAAHRWVWEREHGPVPEGFVVYHMDRDMRNNDPSNLDVVPKEMMGEIFNREGRNQYTKKS